MRRDGHCAAFASSQIQVSFCEGIVTYPHSKAGHNCVHQNVSVAELVKQRAATKLATAPLHSSATRNVMNVFRCQTPKVGKQQPAASWATEVTYLRLMYIYSGTTRTDDLFWHIPRATDGKAQCHISAAVYHAIFTSYTQAQPTECALNMLIAVQGPQAADQLSRDVQLLLRNTN